MTLILAIPYLVFAAVLLVRYAGRQIEAQVLAEHHAQQKAQVRQIKRAWRQMSR